MVITLLIFFGYYLANFLVDLPILVPHSKVVFLLAVLGQLRDHAHTFLKIAKIKFITKSPTSVKLKKDSFLKLK